MRTPAAVPVIILNTVLMAAVALTEYGVPPTGLDLLYSVLIAAGAAAVILGAQLWFAWWVSSRTDAEAGTGARTVERGLHPVVLVLLHLSAVLVGALVYAAVPSLWIAVATAVVLILGLNLANSRRRAANAG